MSIILGASLMLNIILILGYRAAINTCKKQIRKEVTRGEESIK